MRVITGTARGRRLKELQGMETRPTTDKVKESLFSIIQFDIEGRRVLDLFAGTGAWRHRGPEPWSGGGGICGPASGCRASGAGESQPCAALPIGPGEVGHAGVSQKREKFDLIFLDPPYAADLLEQALTAIASFDICREHGIIVAESAADKVLPELPAPYRLYREYRYGKIRLSVYHRSGNEDETT